MSATFCLARRCMISFSGALEPLAFTRQTTVRPATSHMGSWGGCSSIHHSNQPSLESAASANRSIHYFDLIDDDCSHNEGTPNTGTYWRPGPRFALQFCRLFSKQHAFTAAQGTCTESNIAILDPDRNIFDQGVHLDLIGPSISGGKDITITTDRLERALLFDNKLKNFRPKSGRNGILVKKYLSLEEDYFGEMQEVGRMLAISLLTLYLSDTGIIAKYCTGEQYMDQFRWPFFSVMLWPLQTRCGNFAVVFVSFSSLLARVAKWLLPANTSGSVATV